MNQSKLNDLTVKNIFPLMNQSKLNDLTVKNIFPLMNQSKLTDLTVKNIFFTGESVKMQITDSNSENLTNLDLERRT